MKRILAVAMTCSALFSGTVNAEILFGINYYATLGDIKKLYPNAQYTKLTPAWVTENDAFFKIVGPGLPVDLRVKFEDLRPVARSMIAAASATDDVDFYKSMVKQSDDDALSVEWVRAIYPSPVKLTIFKKRYGEPAKCAHDEAFDLLCLWPDKALEALMTEDGKSITFVSTSFTKKEMQDGYLKRHGTTPPWLK